MILVEEAVAERYAAVGLWGKATLDGLLARQAVSRPDSVALAGKWSGDGSSPKFRELSWAELQRQVTALASAFVDAGLRQDDVIAIQLPNTVEAVLAQLAALRAGLIPAALPPLWRRRELSEACGRLSPAALITATLIDEEPHTDIMCHVAAENSSVRHVFAFGDGVPDGVQPLDPLLSAASSPEFAHHLQRNGNPADHVAIITFNETRSPRCPIARSHNQWLSAGSVVVLSARIGSGAVLATPCMPTSLAGLASGMIAWLLTGCRLSLLMPQDLADAGSSLAGATHLVAPGQLASIMLPRAAADGVKLVRIWRDPSRPLLSVSGNGADILSLGEMALLGPEEGDRFTIPLVDGLDEQQTASELFRARMLGGIQKAGKTSAPGALLSGALVVDGPQVPQPFGPPAEPDVADAAGFRSTGLRCRLTSANPPRARIVGHAAETFTHGGIVLHASELDRLYAGLPGVRDAAALAVPDPLVGHRFHAAVIADDGPHCSLAACRDHLIALGVAPYFLPERVVPVAEIPRATDGAVLRSLIQSETAA